jgi:ribosomal-protein-alanine N-acetyltransferase
MELLPGISVTHTRKIADLAWCAAEMAANEPWITLQRSYEDSIQLLEDPLSEVYLFTRNEERLGFIMLKLKGAFTGYIQTIVISEAARGQGLGEAAICYAEEIIFAVSPNAFICVSSFNHRARELYLRLGFEEIGILKDYVRKGYDEVFMRKTRGSWNDFKKQKPVNP